MTQVHYRVDVGPLRNSTAGTYSSECFATQDTAVEYGRVSLRKIATGRNRLGMFVLQLRHDDTTSTLVFNGEDTWQSRVLECHSIGCRIRHRLPKTHQE